MRCRAIVLGVFVLYLRVFAQDQHSPVLPSQFEIGRHTFIDVGPPNDFYELLLVRPAPNGSTVERITLTPAGDRCIQPPKVEVANGTLVVSVADLLGTTDPCSIPEKELRRERKRCKNCLVFSGANVAMRVQCGSTTRIVRSDILDRDMFNPAPNTPEHTSWTMRLLSQIDGAVGPGVMDRPMFAIPGEEKRAVPAQESGTLADISAGKYDELFKSAHDKPSDLYRAAEIRPPAPTVRLVSSTPFQPGNFIQPAYPPLARLARIEGTVNFTVDVSPDGGVASFSVQSGHPWLRGATEKAVRGWKFSKEAAGQTIRAAVEFATNCPAKKA
jgi:TonB family protein